MSVNTLTLDNPPKSNRMDSSVVSSTAENAEAIAEGNFSSSIASISSFHKWTLLFFFSLAQFIDVCNISEMFTSIPTLIRTLKISESQSVWLVSGYQLTFASFLLMGGRLSDICNPKYVFVLGFGLLGVLSLGTGFIDHKIGMLVIRAVTGAFAAFTIPSALNLIVPMWPDAVEEMAISTFASSGAFGNILGLVVGAIFSQLVSWLWVFFFNAIVAIPTALICTFFIPRIQRKKLLIRESITSVKDLDIPGVALLTISIILLIFAMTSGATTKWETARVLVPLVLSVVFIAIFLFYESRIPPERAALPSSVWSHPNPCSPICFIPLPVLWFSVLFLQFTTSFQGLWEWNPLMTAVHFLPVGVTAFIAYGLTVGVLQQKFSNRTIILMGGILLVPTTVLFTRVGLVKSHYWSYIFPALIIGVAGNIFIFLASNVAIVASAPPSRSGVIGALYNSGLQLGAVRPLSSRTPTENKPTRF